MAAASAVANALFERLSQKAAVVDVGEHLTRLVLPQQPQRAHASLVRLLTRIATARDRARPPRSVRRRSLLPVSMWGRSGHWPEVHRVAWAGGDGRMGAGSGFDALDLRFTIFPSRSNQNGAPRDAANAVNTNPNK